MIIALKAYIRKHQLVSLSQLEKAFSASEKALEPMLKHWQNKGLIKPYMPCNACRLPCQQCTTSTNTWYQWHKLSKNISSADA